jgi:phosphoribosylamine--glycine ligase
MVKQILGAKKIKIIFGGTRKVDIFEQNFSHMNILLLGSGGREHALAWKISQSKKLDKLYIAPGNAGTASVGTNVPLELENFEAIKQFVVENDVDMVVVGPEKPLVDGIHDFFKNSRDLSYVNVIGPVKAAAALEGSKSFAKKFMKRHNIPTANYKSFDENSLEDGYRFLESLNPPYVLKADGLAAGKGVVIVNDLEEAKSELKKMIEEAKFGEASTKVVIEEFLSGIELSVFIVTDGNTYLLLPEAKDYKRIGKGDTGLNTGGMGSVSPVPFVNKEFMDKIEEKIIKPTIDGLKADGIPYQGFIFFGLIKVGDEPFVIEYNCRLGDPETESIIPRINNDLTDLLAATADGTLHEQKISIDERYAATVMLVSGGYPEHYEKDKTITGLNSVSNCILFHAGTTTDVEKQDVKTSGGRVLAVTALGTNLKDALDMAYQNAEIIQYEGKTYRSDIGFDL